MTPKLGEKKTARKKARYQQAQGDEPSLTGRSSIGNDFEEDFHEENGTLLIDDIYMPQPPVQPSSLGDQVGQRLLIDTIEIENFKSYGGLSVLGPFYKSFNSIVGPNGSGKSNVIDSMLFVFGYRAQKLRSTKISSIIHNSDTMPNCQYARVTVNFVMINDTGDEDFEKLDDTDFSISRIVNKDNSSYYMINDRRVMFKDVSKRLHEVGIDLRYNRFLILQGEVEQISLMKPKAENPSDTGMLEFLEDIIGTSRYKEPIEKLSLKYNEYNEKRTLFVNRANICQKELKVVQEAKCEAVRAIELENKKKIERSKLLQLHYHKMRSKLTKEENEFEEYNAKYEGITSQLKTLEQEKHQLEEQEKTKSVEHSTLLKESEELKEKYNECSSNDYFLQQRKKNIKERLKKLQSQIDDEHKKLKKLESTPQLDDEDIQQLEQDKIKIEEDLNSIRDKIKSETENATGDCAELMQKRSEIEKEMINFQEQHSDKRTKMNEAYNNYIIHEDKTKSIKTKYDQLCSKKKLILEDIAEKEKFLERYRQEIPSESKKLEHLKQKILKLEKKRDETNEQLTAHNEDLLRLKRSANKAISQDKVRNALMEEMNHGSLEGIFGRLGDLGAIDKKYDVAVSTACGRLKNFVVDTIDNAQNCVEFLKKNNLPTVTFIALDKLRVRWRENVQFPEGVPRLFDLIRVSDEKVRAAFYFALGDTLVANDLTQACRIAYSQTPFRVVTLKGDLIEIDGSMSGGGAPRSGGMGQSIQETNVNSKDLIKELETQVSTIGEERQRLDYEIENLNRDYNNTEKDLFVMNDNLKKYALDVQENQKRLEQTETNLQTQQIEVGKLGQNTELEETRLLYEKAKSIYDKEESKIIVMQEEMSGYDKEVKELLDSRLQPLKKREKSLKKKLDDILGKLNQIVVDRKSHDLSLQKAQENLSQSEKSKQESQQEFESIKIEMKELEVKAADITNKYGEAKKMCEEFEIKFRELQKKIRQLNNRIKELQNEELDFKHEMEMKFKTLKEKQTKAQVLKSEWESIVLDPVDDDEDDGEELNDNDGEDSGVEDEKKTTEDKNKDEDMEVDEIAETPEGDQMLVDDETFSTENSQQTSEPQAVKTKKVKKYQIVELTIDELKQLTAESIEKNIKSIDAELEKLSPNFTSIEEYKEKRREFKQKEAELNQVTNQRDNYMKLLNQCREHRFKEFRTGFSTIARKLKELYRTITLGGDADLEFIDSLDPFSEGINFAVRPNKKSWKNNINLSGGEKTLASLALIFALHYYKPSPLYIMDEIDAALDFKNVSIIANYIKQRTKHTQFLIISLRNNMYELAERLIGIYKTFNITKSIAFDPN